MAKYIRNDGGAVHSVADDFDVPEDWEVLDEAAAQEAAPNLFGAPDPRVLATRLSDERDADPADPFTYTPAPEAAPAEPAEEVAA